MATKQLIYYDEGNHTNAKAEITDLITSLNTLKTAINNTTGQTIETATLQKFINNPLNEMEPETLKSIIFDIISAGVQNEQTLFGLTVDREKAKNLIQYPDLSEIKTAIKALPGAIPKRAQREDFIITNGQVAKKAGFDAEYKERFELYAVTEEQIARLAASTQMATMGNELNATKGSEIGDRLLTTGLVNWDIKKRSYTKNNVWIEIGNTGIMAGLLI
jgi:hypothetical protein